MAGVFYPRVLSWLTFCASELKGQVAIRVPFPTCRTEAARGRRCCPGEGGMLGAGWFFTTTAWTRFHSPPLLSSILSHCEVQIPPKITMSGRPQIPQCIPRTTTSLEYIVADSWLLYSPAEYLAVAALPASHSVVSQSMQGGVQGQPCSMGTRENVFVS